MIPKPDWSDPAAVERYLRKISRRDLLSAMLNPLTAFTLAALTMLTASATGQDISSSLERFKLFNACRPMQLAIEVDDDAEASGLTESALQVTPESRLRAARLYTENYIKADFSFLYVNLNVVGQAFSISVEYWKSVTDAFGERSEAMTWSTRGTGTYGSDAGFIVSGISQYLDKFLAAYLRVNEEACEAK